MFRLSLSAQLVDFLLLLRLEGSRAALLRPIPLDGGRRQTLLRVDPTMGCLHVLAQFTFRAVRSVALYAGDQSHFGLCHVCLLSESSSSFLVFFRFPTRCVAMTASLQRQVSLPGSGLIRRDSDFAHAFGGGSGVVTVRLTPEHLMQYRDGRGT